MTAVPQASPLYLLNSPILTNYGMWSFTPVPHEVACQMVTAGFESAIGHQAAAQFLSLLLKVDVPVQRVSIAMEPGDQAIVLRLLRRLPEGAVLDQQAMQQVPFELGLLKRVS